MWDEDSFDTNSISVDSWLFDISTPEQPAETTGSLGRPIKSRPRRRDTDDDVLMLFLL
jgi:hypothetical protein